MICALRDREYTFENNLKIMYFSTDNFLECHDILTEIKPKSCKNALQDDLIRSVSSWLRLKKKNPNHITTTTTKFPKII